MLFLKPKPKSEELLPPPPPFSILELEEEKPVLNSDNKQKEEDSGARFAHLFDDIDEVGQKKEPMQNGEKLKSLKIKTKLSQFRKSPKQAKATKSKFKPKKAKEFADSKLEDDLNLDGTDFNFPKDLEQAAEKDFGFDKLAEFDAEDNYDKNNIQAKPQELIEAEDEIKSAIDDIKGGEKPSLFRKLFRGEKPEAKVEKPLMQEIPKDGISQIKGKLEDARNALMNFDLKSARENYADIMVLYNGLNPEEQAKVYYEIKNLYYERKSAEGLNY